MCVTRCALTALVRGGARCERDELVGVQPVASGEKPFPTRATKPIRFVRSAVTPPPPPRLGGNRRGSRSERRGFHTAFVS